MRVAFMQPLMYFNSQNKELNLLLRRHDMAKEDRASTVLYKAMTKPTASNVRAALSHEDLKHALTGIKVEDFKKISKVVAKLDKNDKRVVNKVLSTKTARTVC
jgi:hypothetical protein